MAEQRRRLDMTIRADLYEFVREEAEQTGKPMNIIVDNLLAEVIALKRGEVIQQQSLPVISEIVYTALRRHRAELRAELREDMRAEVVDILREVIRKSTDRIVALVLRTVRDASIIRRLVYTLISKAYSSDFARKVYEDAKEKAGQELAIRPQRSEGEKQKAGQEPAAQS